MWVRSPPCQMACLKMDSKTLERRADWSRIRPRLADVLCQRAIEQGLDAAGLAQKMGRKAFAIEQVLSGRLKTSKRYEAVALALSWTLEDALEQALGEDSE